MSGVALRRTVVLLLASLALPGDVQRPADELSEAARTAATLGRWVVQTGGIVGLSDLTRDGTGATWSISERQPTLVRLALDGEAPGLAATPLPIAGMPIELEAEGLAWLAPGTFLVGTESDVARRPSDLLVTVQVDSSGARVSATEAFSYAAWGLQAAANAGLEGICAAGGQLVVASETVGRTAAGDRYAPLARRPLTGGPWQAFRLRLTSARGKLAALSCTALGDHLRVWAIERHFGITHLLEFELPTATASAATAAEASLPPLLLPRVRLDLSAVGANLEGLTEAADGALLLLSDNHYGVTTGPTLLLRLRL